MCLTSYSHKVLKLSYLLGADIETIHATVLGTGELNTHVALERYMYLKTCVKYLPEE